MTTSFRSTWPGMCSWSRTPAGSSSTGTGLPTTWPARCGSRRGVTRATARFSDLIGELSTRSEAFSTRWARQNVRLHRTARKRLHNHVVGDIELTGDALELVGDGLTLIVYTADADSRPQDQLRLLAAWRPPPREADTAS